MNVKIRHKLIEIEDRVSDRFVILIINYRWLRILEVIRFENLNLFSYRLSNFIYSRNRCQVKQFCFHRKTRLIRRLHT